MNVDSVLLRGTPDLENNDSIELHGIKFFDNRASCISHAEQPHWLKKTLSLIESLGRFFIFVLYKLGLILRRVEAGMAPLTTADPGRLTKRRLVVCIHGLNDNPSRFEKIIGELQSRNLSETDIFIPYVLQKGHAKLDEMTKPIFEKIATWANHHQGSNELILVGISNGARISRNIEVELAKAGTLANISKLRVVSIVGACKGSSIVNLTHRLGLSWLLSKSIAAEMATDSKRNEQLSKEWIDALGTSSGPTRDYTFIAAQHDWVVPNHDSTLMDVSNETARYAIVPGYGHNSIVNTVSKAVADIIIE